MTVCQFYMMTLSQHSSIAVTCNILSKSLRWVIRLAKLSLGVIHIRLQEIQIAPNQIQAHKNLENLI